MNNKLAVRLASEAAAIVPYAFAVRWLFIPGAWERDTRAALDWLESLDEHWYALQTWIHRLLAKVWARIHSWTREPERVWERMRADYVQGGYDGDRDNSAPIPSPDVAEIPESADEHGAP